MHNGEIEVFSEGLGCGSEFRVRLPMSEQLIPPVRTPVVPNHIKTIVVVEDIADAREMLQGLLEMKGYDVQCAGDGLSGLELIQKVQPDVSLIDIGLPEIDGYEIARRLRANSDCESLFLIALTGYGQSSDHDAVTEAGFDEHLVKLLDLEQLSLVLSRHAKGI
ncbi:MAG: response regulator [Rubripirellula sp.]